MYKPLVFEIPQGKNDILVKIKEKNIVTSTSINEPKISLGFHYFFHRTKDSMSITNDLKTKNKFYYVVNPFEHIISDYSEDINTMTRKFFRMKEKDPNILSRAFYKMWEMLVSFELIEKDNLTYAALAEAPGSFIQAVIEYREKFSKTMKKDKVFSVTIKPEDGNYIEMSKQFLGHYNKKYSRMIKVHKTYSLKKLKEEKYKGNDNGDITKLNTISNFKKDVLKSKKYADLVTADGGFKWDNENYQEQEAYQLILGEMIGALSIQAKGGHFVLKIFESFTDVTLKLIYLLSSFYENCYIYKPFISRESNSEKYIVCKNFLMEPGSKKIMDKIATLEKLLEDMGTKEYTNDIFPSLKLPSEFVSKMKYINIQVMNRQQVIINKIITYIKNNNYYGEAFHKYRKAQIEANKWWLDTYYHAPEDYNKNRKKLIENVNKRASYNNSEIKNFSKVLVI